MGTVVTLALLMAVAMETGLEVDMGSQLGRGIDMENQDEWMYSPGTYRVALTTCTVYLT